MLRQVRGRGSAWWAVCCSARLRRWGQPPDWVLSAEERAFQALQHDPDPRFRLCSAHVCTAAAGAHGAAHSPAPVEHRADAYLHCPKLGEAAPTGSKTSPWSFSEMARRAAAAAAERQHIDSTGALLELASEHPSALLYRPDSTRTDFRIDTSFVGRDDSTAHDSTISPFALVADELSALSDSVSRAIGLRGEHPVLDAAARYFFTRQGKRMRPALVLLVSHSIVSAAVKDADSPLVTTVLNKQRKVAEIAEMIHVASVLHDDVIDVSDTRRGAKSVNAAFGNQLAVLAGDFLLARASVALARLRNCDVVETLSTVIEHLVCGEVLQMHHAARDSAASPDSLMDAYLSKTYFKTASLMAHSARATAMLAAPLFDHSSGSSSSASHTAGALREYTHVELASYAYGEKLGMAFQLVDDALDVSATPAALGKPAGGADLRSGLATAPVLFALRDAPWLSDLMKRRFGHEGDVERALSEIERSRGVQQTMQLAHAYATDAVRTICTALPPSPHRSALVNLADFVLQRSH